MANNIVNDSLSQEEFSALMESLEMVLNQEADAEEIVELFKEIDNGWHPFIKKIGFWQKIMYCTSYNKSVYDERIGLPQKYFDYLATLATSKRVMKNPYGR